MDAQTLSEYRFGTAGFADARMLNSSGVYDKSGLFCGVDENGKYVYSDGQAAALLVGGARGRKGSLIIPWLIADGWRDHIINMDWKGQNGAIAALQVKQNRRVVNWNPRAQHGLPSHNIDPTSYIDADSPTLEADVRVFSSSWLPLTGDPRSEYFEVLGQRGIAATFLTMTRKQGRVTLPDLADVMAGFGGTSERWLATEYDLSLSPDPWIQEVAEDMKRARAQGSTDSGGFNGIKNEILKSFMPVTDPQLRAAVSNPTFCFSELTKPGAPAYMVNIMEEMRYAETSSPIIRALYACARVYKERAPISTTRPQLWVLDEVGNIKGGFPMALENATFGAGYGIRTVFIVQSTTQLNNIAHNGAKVIPNSCATHIFTAIRDPDQAQMVTNLLGRATIQYDDFAQQEKARQEVKRLKLQAFMRGADPLQAVMEATHYDALSTHRQVQARNIRNPDEVMNEKEGVAYVFMRGRLERPILTRIPKYWQRFDLRGRYLGDPFHSKPGTVELRTMFGQKVCRIIKEPVPLRYQGWPQYADDTWRYVDGYRP